MTAALKADLGDQISKKHALVVVGTGVSLAATGGNALASWKGLIADGVRRCVDRGICKPTWADAQKGLLEGDLDDLLGVAEQVSRRLGWKPTEPCGGDWNKWLRDTVGALKATDANLIEAIRDLGVPIATLNYDNLLTDVTNRRPITWKSAERWLPVLQGTDQAILHLHGHWDQPSSVVLGIRSYVAVMGKELAQHLQQVIASLRSLIFIGCSGTVQDPNFSALIEWMRQQLRGAEHSHYLLLRDGESLPVEESRLREARIVPLRYGAEHADLLPFICGLATTGFPTSTHTVPPEPLAGVIPNGPVVVRPSVPAEMVRALTDDQKEKAVSSLRKQRNYFGYLRKEFKAYFRHADVPGSEESLVSFCMQRSGGDVEQLFWWIRRSMKVAKESAPHEAGAIEEAAAHLYCLAASRVINERELSIILEASKGKDYLIFVPTDINIICAIIAMTISGGEIELHSSEDTEMPEAKNVWILDYPQSDDQLEVNIARKIFAERYKCRGDIPEACLETGSGKPLTPDDKHKLKAYIHQELGTVKYVERQISAFVIRNINKGDEKGAESACRKVATEFEIPVMLPSAEKSMNILGMDVDKLTQFFRGFWREASSALSRASRHDE